MSYSSVRLEEGVAARFKELARENGRTLSEQLSVMVDGGSGEIKSINERLDKLGIYLKEQFERIGGLGGSRTDPTTDPEIKWEETTTTTPAIPPELEGIGADELPECCQGIYGAGEPTCPHWEKAWVKEYGNKVIGYKNILTGRAASDHIYDKYV